MNFRQINLLNTLEAKVSELEDKIRVLSERIVLLENPPKRPRGRPRKNVN